MTAPELRTSTAALMRVANKSEHAADELSDRYVALARSVASALDQEKWCGAAADACRQAWSEWSDGYRLVVMALRDEATALATAASAYHSTDAAGGSAIDDSMML